MDEAEMYKQRLEAIAVKRRLQEEQERAKRDMEDEKLRLQQLKRKSLRDQWLMEGAPFSTSSQDSQSLRSFPWASPDVGENRSQSAEVSGEDEEEETTEGQTESVQMEEDTVEMLRGAVLQNGYNNTKRSGKIQAEVKASQTSPRDEDANVNGDLKERHIRQHDGTSELWNSQATTNGSSEKEPGSSLLVNVPKLSHTALDEGVVVMRAERVIITDDEEEDVGPQDEQQSEETPQKIPVSAGETGEEVKVSLKASIESVKTETHAESGTGQSGTDEDGDCEDNQMEAPASVVVMESTAIPLEGPPVAPVPVYSESQPSGAPKSKGEIPAAATEAADTSSLKALNDSIAKASQFHEVLLSVTLGNLTTEAEPGEQEPLLEEVKAHSMQKGEVATTADSQLAGTEIRAEAIQIPKKKSCQCCSVM